MYKTAMVDLEQDFHSFTWLASLHVILDHNSSKIESLSKFLQLHSNGFLIYFKLSKGVTSYASLEAKSTTLIKICLNELSYKKTSNASCYLQNRLD